MKRILLVSDTHGKEAALLTVLDREKPPFDLLLHMGDVEGGENMIESFAKCECRFVRGNNDFFVPLPREQELEIGKYHAMMTHGHYYGVSLGYETLAEEAASRGCDLVFCGHTHKPVDMRVGSVRIINPGSISYPRQENHVGTYMILTEEDGEIDIKLCYV